MATVEPNFTSRWMCDPQTPDPTPAPPPRLLPDAVLPPYSYVTGRYPHPTRDSAGHSYGHFLQATPFDPQRWRASREYLLGCELFNHGYYWEAHETWEAAWQACGRHGTVADFLKGLIKLARQAGAANPALLGNQLGLLYEGAAALSTSLDDPAPWTHARKAVTTLIDQAVG